MNSNLPHQLAAQLKANPSFFEDIDEALLCDIVFHHVQGRLSEDDSAEVEMLLRTNAKAHAIRERLHAADRFTASETGRAALDGLLGRVLPPKKTRSREAAAPTLLECISTAITDLFTFRATLATASGEEGLKRKLTDGQTQIAVHSDSAGRLWLRVTSTAEEFRNGSFKLDIEPAPSVLTFTEVEPGLYSARVCVNEEVAAELAKGAVPKLTPLPPTEG